MESTYGMGWVKSICAARIVLKAHNGKRKRISHTNDCLLRDVDKGREVILRSLLAP